MRPILIMGGAGFIGSALLRQLGPGQATVFDNFASVSHTPATIAAFGQLSDDFIVGDSTSLQDVSDLFDRGIPETLVYLVAETGTGRSLHNVQLNARVNVQGMALVLDEIARRGQFPKRVLITSSRAVYGEGPYADANGRTVHPPMRGKADLDARRFDYDGLTPLAMDGRVHLPKPVNIYGSTKLAQENLLANWCTSFEVPLYLYRLQNVYGAGQSLSNPYTGVLIAFLRFVSQGKPIPVFENGGITRDFVHVDDVAAALAAGIRGDGAPGIFDIGCGERQRLLDVAEMIAEIAGGGSTVITQDYRLGDVRHAAADNGAARDGLGWAPRVSLRDGLTGLLEFFRSGAA